MTVWVMKVNRMQDHSKLREEVKSANARTKEAQAQCEFLKEQIASLKAENDLQIQKTRTENEEMKEKNEKTREEDGQLNLSLTL